MSDVTIAEMRDLVDEWLTLREEVQEKQEEVKELNKALTPLTQRLAELLDSMDLTRFDGYKGKVNLVKVDYVSNPATDEERLAFNEYLKREGIFDEMVSVHHQKLNSFYKHKLEEAIEHGHELNIPGLSPKQRVEIRKGR
jgi:hypothetical protein